MIKLPTSVVQEDKVPIDTPQSSNRAQCLNQPSVVNVMIPDPILEEFSKLQGDFTRVMSYNIRIDHEEDSNPQRDPHCDNAWSKRRDKVEAVIRRYNPDVIALQEPNETQINDFADVRRVANENLGRDATWVGWEYNPFNEKKQEVMNPGIPARFDQFFVSSNMNVLRSAVGDDQFTIDNRIVYPSDHRPMIVDVVLQ
ncbi:MAG: hypothetical protein JSR46_04460 [Verrucomicrobia bacterium]|nr:hypothetical protein [Verrucomicrobiota bacterium]